MKKKVRGFTLIELMVVIAIITVLSAIIVPNVIMQIRSNRVTEQNLYARQIYDVTSDYLINLQKRGLNARTYFAETTETDRYCFFTFDNIDKSVDAGTANALTTAGNSKAFDTTSVSWNYGYAASAINAADTDDRKPHAAMLGIRRQLTGSTGAAKNNNTDWFDQGSWGVIIDMDTYTCIAAFYNKDGGATYAGNPRWAGISLTANHPFSSTEEQINALGAPSEQRKNTGQYPIPA
ncbi:MAG: type II secretion system protein [Oscillospiraceae bacterium]|nr:type II secretion system protein [Oscillospiraceae bacterium]